MIRERMAWIGLLVLLFFGAAHCGARAQQKNLPEGVQQGLGPGPLLPIDASSEDFFAEHRVQITWQGERHSMRAVLQKQEALLELIILGPMEQPMVRVYQDGQEVGVDAYVEDALPFTPEFMLADVQKAFLIWEDAHGAQREGRYDTLHWTQTRDGEQVQMRTFWREELGEGLPLTVHYEYDEDAQMPAAVRLENRWFGYTLDIQTLRWSPL